MKLPRFLLGLFTLLLCFCLTDLNAQCRKNKSKTQNKQTNQNINPRKTDQATYRYYTSDHYRTYRKDCSRSSYTSRCGKKKNNDTQNDTRRVPRESNYTGLLVGAMTMLDEERTAFSTGVEYERFLNRYIGVGVSAEAAFGEDANLVFGLPISFHPSKRIRLLASPLGAFRQISVVDRSAPVASDEVVLTKEWDNSFGARIGISYFLTTKGLRIAPMIRADYINNQVTMNYGITAGIGF